MLQNTYILKSASNEGAVRLLGVVGVLVGRWRVAKLAAVGNFLVGITRFVFNFVLPVHLVRRAAVRASKNGSDEEAGETE